MSEAESVVIVDASGLSFEAWFKPASNDEGDSQCFYTDALNVNALEVLYEHLLTLSRMFAQRTSEVGCQPSTEHQS